MAEILKVSDITKEYIMGEVKVEALRGVSFGVEEGEFIVILGPSGSGKSTMLNIIGGIDKPTSGEIIYDGKNIAAVSDKELTNYRRQVIGFVFQFYNLIPNLTAKENVLLSSEISSDPLDADELLKKVNLFERADHFPSKLSGGEQQRVAIARALAKNPKILLCDEPTGALDVNTGVQILKLLVDFNKEYKKTVVIITHNAEIGKIGDKIYKVKDGLIENVIENESKVAPEEVNW